MTDRGVIAYGAYIPPRRLGRDSIAAAMSWANPSLEKQARGERAVCAWDEDTITMAVAAARDCGADLLSALASIQLASTTLPFADRSNAGVVAAALGLVEGVIAGDATGSQRAGTTALIGALERHDGTELIIGAERRTARPGSPEEMQFGHGAAALLIGDANESLARGIGRRVISRDLVDHYRSSGERFDHTSERRWLRDEGFLKIVPDVIEALLADVNLTGDAIDHVILPGARSDVARICSAVGIDSQRCAPSLVAQCGDAGVADPLLRLCAVFEQAGPGERVLLIGFGQGADALLFETTDKVSAYRPAVGVTGHLARRTVETSYTRYLAHAGQLDVDWGGRAEFDNRAALTTFYRKRDAVTGFVGGQCPLCDTIQFPRARACVNPECRAFGEQQPVSLARVTGKVKTFTEDWLAFTPDPPLRYGNIEFDVGGNLLMEIIDADGDELRVGLPVEMSFRVKEVDWHRNLPRYFWKATPRTTGI